VPWSDLYRRRRSCRAHKIALTAALYIIVSGCQPVPQPFARPEETFNPVVVPTSDFAGVTILPIRGLPAPAARNLSTAMAEELLAREIIASPESSNQRSRFLQGVVTRTESSGALTRVTMTWELFDHRWKSMGRQDTTHTIPRSDWTNGSQAIVRPLVKEAAAVIAGLVKGENDRSLSTSQISLHVWPVDGAPDKTAFPLRQAMEAALKKRNFRITEGLDGAGLVIAGVIELGPENVEPRPIRITWSVLDTAGKELGKLTQQNAVPRETMENTWDTLAAVIADNAAGGVGDLVAQLPRSTLRPGENAAK